MRTGSQFHMMMYDFTKCFLQLSLILFFVFFMSFFSSYLLFLVLWVGQALKNHEKKVIEREEELADQGVRQQRIDPRLYEHIKVIGRCVLVFTAVHFFFSDYSSPSSSSSLCSLALCFSSLFLSQL